MSGISFIRNLHIRIKNGVSTPPVGYAAMLRFGAAHIPARKPGKIVSVDSPILKYAQDFADSHRDIGYLSDNRLSQDAYNYAGLKLSYLKKGLNEQQADIQAKRDVVKNLEIRSMELDLIQNQALKIGIPSFQPKTHLEHIETLSKKISDRKNEYTYIEKRENLEAALAIKFQYGDMKPLPFSQVSMFSPIEYFVFVKEHPEYQNVLFQPICQDEEKVVPDELKSENNKHINIEDKEMDEDRLDDLDEDSDSRGAASGFKISDYAMSSKNRYFVNFSKGTQSYNNLISDIESIEFNSEDELKGEEDEQLGSGVTTNFNETDDILDEYENSLDETKLKRDDICIELVDLKTLPDRIERNQLIEDKLKKNFYSKESLSQSKINIDQGRFIYQESGFPSAADIPLDKYARLPTVSSIKTLRHFLSIGGLSQELLEYLERQDGGRVDSEDQEVVQKDSINEIYSAESNIRKNYLLSDLSHIETLKNLKRYNDIPVNDRLNSTETDLKETYVNTVLNVTDKLYTTPIDEQRLLKKKFGNEFIFEETNIDQPNQPIDPLKQLEGGIETTPPLRGPIIEEDGLIDLRNTNIFSHQNLYESYVTNNYINKLEAQSNDQQSLEGLISTKEQSEEEEEKVDFQSLLSTEALNIASGKSTIDPLYLLNANNNRSTLLYQNSRNQQQQQPWFNDANEIDREDDDVPSSPISFDRFFENYILPNDIEQYSKHYAPRIIKCEDRIKSKLNQELLLKQHQHNQDSIIKDRNLIIDGPTYERLSLLKLKFDNSDDPKEKSSIKFEVIKALEEKSNQTLADRENSHNALYPEYYGSTEKVIKEKKISEELIRDVIDSGVASHQYNAATNSDKEDKVDFRSLTLDAETEHKFAKEIKEFRDKDSKGLITDHDSFEFTNYINYLKEASTTSPVIQAIKSSIHMKSNNNEMIDQFNTQYLEQDIGTGEDVNQLSKEALTFKQLEEMFPLESDRESALNTLLFQNTYQQKIQKLEDDFINAASNDTTFIPQSKVLSQTLADAQVEFTKENTSPKKQTF
ncbi:hypothetical protein RB653_009649 [Dictyostelium firmibasis]|uniref:Uncharacterized protein n=1 Tax=Dictyostelium firmibasis TaxID=79012 RepID=A0AAN7U6G3_9MYCE